MIQTQLRHFNVASGHTEMRETGVKVVLHNLRKLSEQVDLIKADVSANISG